MAANTAPIYTLAPDVQWGSTDGNGGAAGPLKTANTAKDGTGTVLTVFTAGADGSYVQEIRARSAGTNVASVMRVFLNNGSSNATIANNIMIAELQLPATTLTEIAALADYTINIQRAIPAGYKLNVTLGTTVAAGYFVSCFGGNY